MHSPAKRGALDGGWGAAPGQAVTLTMTWWERWAFNLLHALVAGTGVAYFGMKYLMVPTDPFAVVNHCLLYTSPSPRDGLLSRMPSSA